LQLEFCSLSGPIPSELGLPSNLGKFDPDEKRHVCHFSNLLLAENHSDLGCTEKFFVGQRPERIRNAFESKYVKDIGLVLDSFIAVRVFSDFLMPCSLCLIVVS
jgi:hypothetical protein